MTDEELLKQAELNLLGAVDHDRPQGIEAQLVQESIAASLLVIARNSVPVEVDTSLSPALQASLNDLALTEERYKGV